MDSMSFASQIPLILLWLLGVNFWTVFRFWQDKCQALRGGWRIPESTLLALAFIGGSPGALLARYLFRHKTRKEPFSTRLLVIAGLQIGIVAGLVVTIV